MKSDKNRKFRVITADLGPARALSNQNLESWKLAWIKLWYRWWFWQKEFAIIWPNSKLSSIMWSVWFPIILVMICVVLPPAGEGYCCIQKIFVETVSTTIYNYCFQTKLWDLRLLPHQTWYLSSDWTSGFRNLMVGSGTFPISDRKIINNYRLYLCQFWPRW